MASKKSAKKTGAGKKAVRKTVAKKPVKKASKKVSAKKPAAKKTAGKKPAPKKAVAEEAPARVSPAEAPVRKRPARKAAIIDPLTPRKRRAAKKLDVLRPGRKNAHKASVKPKSYRSMKAGPRAAYKVQLLELRERIFGQVSSLKKESLTRADEVNVEEDGTDAFDRQFALTLASSENEALVEIDAALQRIEDGTYGKCQECGGGIETARLKAIPFVSNCIACQSEVERQRPGYRPPLRLD